MAVFFLHSEFSPKKASLTRIAVIFACLYVSLIVRDEICQGRQTKSKQAENISAMAGGSRAFPLNTRGRDIRRYLHGRSLKNAE